MEPDDKKPVVTLFTDGACVNNPGPGGWAFILLHPASGRRKEMSGGEHGTTNNRMEVLAMIRGLEALKGPSQVHLVSDSQYLISAVTGWMAKWKRFGWRRTPRGKDHVKNADLWQRLDQLLQGHKLTTEWVRGHNGHPENERCDQLAEAAAAHVATLPPPPEAPKVQLKGLIDGGSLYDQAGDEGSEE